MVRGLRFEVFAGANALTGAWSKRLEDSTPVLLQLML
jgi:hypothetical protein